MKPATRARGELGLGGVGWGGVGMELGGVVCWMVTAFLHNVVKFYTGETMYTRYTLPHNKDTHHSVSDIFCIHEAVRLFPHLLLVYKVHRCSPNLGDTHIPKHMHRVHQAAIHTLPTSTTPHPTPPQTPPHPTPPLIVGRTHPTPPHLQPHRTQHHLSNTRSLLILH